PPRGGRPPAGRRAPPSVRLGARDGAPCSARWSRPAPALPRSPAGTASATWRCRHGYTHGVGGPVPRAVARRPPAAGWLGRAPLHPDTRARARRLPPPDRPARSAPFFFRLRIRDRHHASLALALGGARRTPGARTLVGTA